MWTATGSGWSLRSLAESKRDEAAIRNDRNAEQNGCRQRLEGYLSCQQRLALAVA